MPMSTLHVGRCWWDSNLRTSACRVTHSTTVLQKLTEYTKHNTTPHGNVTPKVQIHPCKTIFWTKISVALHILIMS